MEPATALSEPLVGREPELRAVHDLLSDTRSFRALVLAGEPGIGKTSLWAAGIEAARQRGVRVLTSSPAAPEAELSYAGLADLLDDVEDDVLVELPEPQRRALEVALLRSQPEADDRTEPRAVAFAIRGALRALSSAGLVLVAVDDVQWLDAASQEALAFAARRLEQEPVRFLLARRPGEGSPLERALARVDLVTLEIVGLSFGAIRSLVARTVQESLPRQLVRRIYASSGGNPLFALELTRQLVASGGTDGELVVPERLEDLVGARTAQLAPEVRRVLAAASLGETLRTAQLTDVVGSHAVNQAVQAGVLVVDDERARPAHPLLAEAARRALSRLERQALHRALATVSTDEETQIRHLAGATSDVDAALADRAAAAADQAAARGASGDAAELAEHALRLTPPNVPDWSRRLLDAAERLVAAGEHRRARDLLDPEFRGLPAGPLRARAALALDEAAFHTERGDPAGALIQLALAESEADPALHVRASARWSHYLSAGVVERIAEAERYAEEALAIAEGTDPALERSVLHALALARKLRGRPIDDLVARFDALSNNASLPQRSVVRIAAARLGSRGHVTEARDAFQRLRALADEREDVWSSIWLLHQLCELELQAGELRTASALLDEWDQSPDKALIGAEAFARCQAQLAACIGNVDDAERWSNATIDGSRVPSRRWNMLEGMRARGLALLLAHDFERAAENLLTVWEHAEQAGVDELGDFPVAPDLVEALVELGWFDEARAVTQRIGRLAREQEHPWGLAVAERSQALIELAEAGDVAAVPRLIDAANGFLALGDRFDHARTLRAAGRAARRHKKWGPARELLENAVSAFDAIGSHGWSDETRLELERVGGRRRAVHGMLTAAEQLVVERAIDGLTNKQIAEQLSLSPHTVERHLAHAYAKLGVRTRTQLARRLSAPG